MINVNECLLIPLLESSENFALFLILYLQSLLEFLVPQTVFQFFFGPSRREVLGRIQFCGF